LAVLRAFVGRGDMGTVKALNGASLFICHESSARGLTAIPVLTDGPRPIWLDRFFNMGCEAWDGFIKHEGVEL